MAFQRRSLQPESTHHRDAAEAVGAADGLSALESMYDTFVGMIRGRSTALLVEVKTGDVDGTVAGSNPQSKHRVDRRRTATERRLSRVRARNRSALRWLSRRRTSLMLWDVPSVRSLPAMIGKITTAVSAAMSWTPSELDLGTVKSAIGRAKFGALPFDKSSARTSRRVGAVGRHRVLFGDAHATPVDENVR